VMLMMKRLILAAVMAAFTSAAHANDAGDPDQSCDGSTAEMVERSVRMVPGVVDVRAAVSWSMDDKTLKPSGLDPVFPFGAR